ncbi:MAG: TlpA family protein disulfide reductase [Rickettsiales bacterium]|jgi:thiol-disulfide isomerase/thioredoxin|nr:TlpA family protein disulfide reductase [Rickettsiales bacterium]
MQPKKIVLFLMLLSLLGIVTYNIARHDPYYYNPKAEVPSDNIPKASIEALAITEDVPELQFINKNGDLKSIFDYKNKVILVNFWATWCLPCVKELPTLNNLKVKYRDQIEIITISIDSSEFNEVKGFFEKMNLKSLNYYMDHNNLSYVASRSLGVPTTLLIDSNYKIHYRISGFVDWSLPENQILVENLFQTSSK